MSSGEDDSGIVVGKNPRLPADCCAAARWVQYAALVFVRVEPDEDGPDHRYTLAARHDLARWTGEAGDAAGARDRLAALLPIVERLKGPEHPRTLDTRHSLASWTGKTEEAAPGAN